MLKGLDFLKEETPMTLCARRNSNYISLVATPISEPRLG